MPNNRITRMTPPSFDRPAASTGDGHAAPSAYDSTSCEAWEARAIRFSMRSSAYVQQPLMAGLIGAPRHMTANAAAFARCDVRTEFST
jgi:hypothetical protein